MTRRKLPRKLKKHFFGTKRQRRRPRTMHHAWCMENYVMVTGKSLLYFAPLVVTTPSYNCVLQLS